MGDLIVRGLYKDLACGLSGHDSLLYPVELKFNRHLNRTQEIFGERVDMFFVDYSNSTNNIEERTLQSTALNYYVKYIFASRIWNNQMEKVMSSVRNYDVILIR